MSYLVVGRSIDGTVWLEAHTPDYTVWSSEKIDAHRYATQADAEAAIRSHREKCRPRELDDTIGQLRIVEVAS